MRSQEIHLAVWIYSIPSAAAYLRERSVGVSGICQVCLWEWWDFSRVPTVAGGIGQECLQSTWGSGQDWSNFLCERGGLVNVYDIYTHENTSQISKCVELTSTSEYRKKKPNKQKKQLGILTTAMTKKMQIQHNISQTLINKYSMNLLIKSPMAQPSLNFCSQPRLNRSNHDTYKRTSMQPRITSITP